MLLFFFFLYVYISQFLCNCFHLSLENYCRFSRVAPRIDFSTSPTDKVSFSPSWSIFVVTQILDCL